jgi:hypothetical protein
VWWKGRWAGRMCRATGCSAPIWGPTATCECSGRGARWTQTPCGTSSTRAATHCRGGRREPQRGLRRALASRQQWTPLGQLCNGGVPSGPLHQRRGAYAASEWVSWGGWGWDGGWCARKLLTVIGGPLLAFARERAASVQHAVPGEGRRGRPGGRPAPRRRRGRAQRGDHGAAGAGRRGGRAELCGASRGRADRRGCPHAAAHRQAAVWDQRNAGAPASPVAMCSWTAATSRGWPSQGLRSPAGGGLGGRWTGATRGMH